MIATLTAAQSDELAVFFAADPTVEMVPLHRGNPLRKLVWTIRELPDGSIDRLVVTIAHHGGRVREFRASAQRTNLKVGAGGVVWESSSLLDRVALDAVSVHRYSGKAQEQFGAHVVAALRFGVLPAPIRAQLAQEIG